jgi:integrase/recombinase XerD
MAIQIRKRKNGDKTTSLFLDIWYDGQRSYEFLTFKLIPGDGEHNKEAMRMAEEIRANRVKEYASGHYNISNNTGLKTSAIVWMEKFAKEYTKADKRNVEGVLTRFKAFLAKEKKTGITFRQIDEQLITDFRDGLIKTCEYSGSTSYFARFKKMMRAAAKQLKFSNPALEVENIDAKAEERDILSVDEIKKLAKTPIQNSEIRRAFLFSCMVGTAWCDVSALTWRNIDLEKKELKYKRQKTEQNVEVPLNESAIQLLGDRQKSKDLIFTLPTADGANKTVKAWVERAKIDKKITWHNARHSFMTNVEGDVLTKSRLGGHAGLTHTMRYVRADKEKNKIATDSVNIAL